jgi:hypothetical protein
MKLRRSLAAVLAAVSLLTLTALPAQASSFPDIQDAQVSQAADLLHALGIVDGDETGRFLPDGHLTRVQFCKMVIELLGKGELALAQMDRTIFTDVGGSHWGRGYVNLAATMVLDGADDSRLMLGMGDGRFEPDRDITYQEAATLLLRVLGYSDEANRAWPDGALRTASALGLDQALTVADPAGAVTRGQTALLFCRLLSIPAKGEQTPYVQKLATVVEDAIVLSTDATLNGQSGWVVTTAGGPYRPAGQVDPALQGQRGDILLDQQGRFLALLADTSQCVTAAVSRALSGSLLAADGTRYTLASDTPVYSGTDGQASTYAETLPSLLPGDVVTLYLENGQVIGVFRAASTAAGSFLVLQKTPSASTLRALTGGDETYTIRKNGRTVSLKELAAYDVLTYDPISKVLYACDTRIQCVLENASPSPSAPSVITVLGGNTFSVMEDAAAALAQYRIGDTLTLLFTRDGQVAGAAERTVDGNAVGVVRGSQLTLIGIPKTLDLSHCDAASRLDGALVSVSGSRGQVELSRLSLSRSDGSFEPSTMRLGRLSVSDSVQIYEQGVNGLAPVALTQLSGSVPKASITGYHADSSGAVDLIVLRNVTGDSSTYGRIEPTNRYEDIPLESTPLRVDGQHYTLTDGTVYDPNGQAVLSQVFDPGTGGTKPAGWYTMDDEGYVRREDGTLVDAQGRRLTDSGYVLDSAGEYVMTKKSISQLRFSTAQGTAVYDVAPGTQVPTGFGAISLYTSRGQEYARVESTLTEISNVRSSDFYTVDGVTYVQAGGAVYQVADNVQCYNATASTRRWGWSQEANGNIYLAEDLWFASLLEARVFSSTLTIYVDSVGSRVRLVSA